MVILLMGVSGSGKTVVGRALGWRFVDADALHPPEGALAVDVSASPESLVTLIRQGLGL